MRGKQIRTFLLILGMTTLVWMAVAMSETRVYPLPVRVEMGGFDANRYAVLHSDSTLTLYVESTGFNALLTSLRREALSLRLDMNSEAVRHYTRQHPERGDEHCHSVAVADVATVIAEQLAPYGIHYSSSAKDSLSLVLNTLSSRVYHPSLDHLKINFSEGYGLYGEPKVVPSEVTLYGPADVLASISTIDVLPQELDHVSSTHSYRVALDTRWKSLGDVRASTETITVHVPVRRYVERRYTVPVNIAGYEGEQHIRLYPDKATLQVWVAQEDIPAVTDNRFSVSVDYSDILSGQPNLRLRVDRFPSNVRIRSLAPEEIEYVIIK